MSFWSKYTHDTVSLFPSADVKIFKADFKLVSTQNVPLLLFFCVVCVFLSKTVAAFPFDLEWKIHLLCFCTNTNNTSSGSYTRIYNTNMYSWCFWYVRVGACVYEGWFLYRRRNMENFNSKYFCPSYSTPTHALSNFIVLVHFMRKMLHCVHFNTKEMGVSMWQKQKIAHFIDRFSTDEALSQWFIA